MLRFTVCLLTTVAACGTHGFPDDPGDHENGFADLVVGAACITDHDCLALCARGDKFPGGFCTLPCATDADCTPDTVCVRDAGGVCAFPCSSDAFCASFLEPAYECRSRENFFDQDRRVCMGD